MNPCKCGCGKLVRLTWAQGHHPKVKRVPMEETLQRFTDKSGGPDACWPWTGHCYRNGYGQINVNRHPRLAHRIAYEHFKGQIPFGMRVLHSCDNPPCCNPAHLSVGTALDNVIDMTVRGRRNDAVGSASSNAKLTEADIPKIREAFANGENYATIRRRYGVKGDTIKDIVTRKTWKHV